VKLSLSPLSIVAVSLISFSFACSSTTRVVTEEKDSGSGSGSDGGTTPSDASVVTDASKPEAKDGGVGPSGSTAAEKCAAETTQTSCQQCCATAEQPAYLAFQNALVKCGCQDTVCKTQCAASLCATTPAQPTTECQTCLGQAQSGACKTDIEKVCTGSGACAPFAECAAVGCAGKR